MNKLRRDVRLAIAGACSGLFSVSVFLLNHRILSYYDYIATAREYHRFVEDLWWVPMVVWNVVLSMAASLLVHRYATGRATTFLHWQAIGFVALLGWTLTLFTGFSMDCLIHGRTFALEKFFNFARFIPIAHFVAAVFAANVLFGTAIQAAATEESIRQSEIIRDT